MSRSALVKWAALGAAAAVLLAVLITSALLRPKRPAAPSFRAQMCGLPQEWLLRTRRGYHPRRSGQISLVPSTPTYMATGAGGWSHSGPWRYLQHVPLVFAASGRAREAGEAGGEVTTADVAPTIASLIGAGFDARDGRPLPEVVASWGGSDLRVIVTVVWDGGGWNTLRRWPDAWPHLRRLMRRGVSYTNATVGSSPSVTPAVHTTLGTGAFPSRHAITGVPVFDDDRDVVDSFLKGESARFLEETTLAQAWDAQTDDRALVGMVGYEPWHLGMIGEGAEGGAGDRDHAAWLDVETNEWITNSAHYDLPPALPSTTGLEADIDELDAADGVRDRAWRSHEILDARDRLEETPAFIKYHTRALTNLIADEGYGSDRVTDLLFTNYKQIDRVGHYFNMSSREVRDSLEATDRELGTLTRFLDRSVGRGRWLMVITADHGQQPDAPAVNGVALDPNEIEADIAAVFGSVVRAVWPTEVFLLEDEMDVRDVEVDEVARWLGSYTLAENSPEFMPDDADGPQRAFDAVIPARLLTTVRC